MVGIGVAIKIHTIRGKDKNYPPEEKPLTQVVQKATLRTENTTVVRDTKGHKVVSAPLRNRNSEVKSSCSD